MLPVGDKNWSILRWTGTFVLTCLTLNVFDNLGEAAFFVMSVRIFTGSSTTGGIDLFVAEKSCSIFNKNQGKTIIFR